MSHWAMVTGRWPLAEGSQRDRKPVFDCHCVIDISTCSSVCVCVCMCVSVCVCVCVSPAVYLTARGLTQRHGWGRGRFEAGGNAAAWTQQQSSSVLTGRGWSAGSDWRAGGASSTPEPRSRLPTPGLQAKPTTHTQLVTMNCQQPTAPGF